MADVRFVTAARLDVPDPDTPLLTNALQARGVEVAVDNWRDERVDWGSAAVTVVRSPWDYVDARDAFVEWAHKTGCVTDLWNPPQLLEWNTHKSYLLELESRGAPVVPTVLMLGGTAASLDAICDARGWNQVVVKPAVGIGARDARRFDVGDRAGQAHLDALLERGDVLVQPYIAGIETVGERSVLLAGGVPTHALRKRPETGDFRVQENWGGSTELVIAEPEVLALAARVCTALPAPTMYARIDMLRGSHGWHVLEVEVTEPSLWLDLAPPAATEAFVAAIISRL